MCVLKLIRESAFKGLLFRWSSVLKMANTRKGAKMLLNAVIQSKGLHVS